MKILFCAIISTGHFLKFYSNLLVYRGRENRFARYFKTEMPYISQTRSPMLASALFNLLGSGIFLLEIIRIQIDGGIVWIFAMVSAYFLANVCVDIVFFLNDERSKAKKIFSYASFYVWVLLPFMLIVAFALHGNQGLGQGICTPLYEWVNTNLYLLAVFSAGHFGRFYVEYMTYKGKENAFVNFFKIEMQNLRDSQYPRLVSALFNLTGSLVFLLEIIRIKTDGEIVWLYVLIGVYLITRIYRSYVFYLHDRRKKADKIISYIIFYVFVAVLYLISSWFIIPR